LSLYAPEYLFTEFRKHRKDILHLTSRSNSDFLRVVAVLERRIRTIPLAEFGGFIKEAESLLDDKDDAAYLAVCLAKGMPLWTNDNGFKKQDKVRIYTTQELIALILPD
jgi:predicted nucleic acid-binding protein